jgi:hypothetical protein
MGMVGVVPATPTIPIHAEVRRFVGLAGKAGAAAAGQASAASGRAVRSTSQDPPEDTVGAAVLGAGAGAGACFGVASF